MRTGWEQLGYALGGGYAQDEKKRRQELQLRAAQTGHKLTEQGDVVPTAELQAKELYNQQKLQAMQAVINQYKANEVYDTFTSSVERGNIDEFNQLKYNPVYKPLFDSQGVDKLEKLDINNPAHTEMIKSNVSKMGLDSDTDNWMSEFKNNPEEWESIQKAFPIMVRSDGKRQIVSVKDIAATIGLHKAKNSIEKMRAVSDVYARGVNTLQGRLQAEVDARVGKAEAEEGKSKSEAQLKEMEAGLMFNWMEQNPDATYADYKKQMSSKGYSPGSLEKDLEYIKNTYGEDAAKTYLQSKSTGKTPASIQKREYEIQETRDILKEAKVDSLDRVDYNKLSQDNKIKFDQLATKQSKNIDKDDVQAFAAVGAAANKLKIFDLSGTTGIIDAGAKSLMDRLGMNLHSNLLVQSANYNLIVNALTRAAFGSQVTGNELERLKAQLGTEFRADKTVRIKMAETLDNTAKKFNSYRTIAPAYYAKELRPKVDDMMNVAKYLRGVDSSRRIRKGTVENGYKYKGGDPANPMNWQEVK